MKNTKQLYHRLVKRGVINKDLQVKDVKKMFYDVSKYNAKKYNAKEDLKKIHEKIK